MPIETATFACGCFWSVELVFQREVGVTDTAVGYIGGKVPNPTYEAVCRGNTGHAEAVQIHYDTAVTSYNKLLSVFFDKHDPTQRDGQGNDSGTQYRSAIFYYTAEQRVQAETVKKEEQKKYSDLIVTTIEPAPTFYRAEEYHQKYLEKGGQCALKGDKSSIRCYG